MKKLPQYFTRKGFMYSLVQRQGDVCMYEQWGTGDAYGDEGDPYFAGYEVFRVRKHGDMMMHGNFLPAAETVPSDNQWGLEAYTCRSLQDAEVRFKQLTDREAAREEMKEVPV